MISDLAYILKSRLPRWLGLLALGSTAAFLVAFVDPIALKLLIDQGLGQKQLRLFIIVSVAIVSLAGLIAVFRFITGVWLQRLKNDLASDLCRRMLAAYYRLPYRQVSAEGEGYFISRVYDEPRKAVDLVLDLSEQVLIRLTTILTSLGVALYLSWRVTVVLGGIVPILYWLSRKFGSRIMSESKVENEAEANFRHGLGRGLSAYVTVKSFDLQKPMTERTLIALDRFLSALYQRVRSTWIFRTFSGLSMSIAEAVVLIIAAVDVFLGYMTLGGMLAYMTAFWKLIYGATGLIEQLPDLSRARGYISRLKDFESEAEVPIPAVSSQVVELRQLSFGYTEQQLFEQLDLTIQPGHPTLLLGPNGCGKTTLGLILSGYLTADCRYAAVSLPTPERISAMLSPLTFFLGTLRQHLQWDALSPEDRALAKSMLADFNLGTKLDSDPRSFSEGEKRKAYLIMCMLKHADLYILDEPLMGVAEGGKKIIMDWIFRRTKGKMLLVAMHGDLQFHSRFHNIVELSGQREPSSCDSISVEPLEVAC